MNDEEIEWLLLQLAEVRTRAMVLEGDKRDVLTLESEATWAPWRDSAPGKIKAVIEGMFAKGRLR